MLEILFILLLILAVIFLLFALEYEGNVFWNLSALMLDITLWLVLALGVLEFHRPYEMYNASSGAIEIGVHNYTIANDIFISYFFGGIAMVLLIYFIAMVFIRIDDWRKKEW